MSFCGSQCCCAHGVAVRRARVLRRQWRADRAEHPWAHGCDRRLQLPTPGREAQCVPPPSHKYGFVYNTGFIDSMATEILG
jgi:hypothetical protein